MDIVEPTDEALIERIGRGEENALILLMERHKQPLFRFVYRYLNNEADSAEATEATFFKVYQNAARFKPKASPKTWIYTIALNLARDCLRKEKKRKGHLSLNAPINKGDSEQPLADRMDSGDPSPSRSLQSDDDLLRIQEHVARLPEKLKFPFVFCILEKHSYDECAAILKTSRKTVETRIYRARQTLKEQLAHFFEKI
jgi:RNA polymerase sigma-70 factor (ECF subfamily)